MSGTPTTARRWRTDRRVRIAATVVLVALTAGTAALWRLRAPMALRPAPGTPTTAVGAPARPPAAALPPDLLAAQWAMPLAPSAALSASTETERTESPAASPGTPPGGAVSALGVGADGTLWVREGGRDASGAIGAIRPDGSVERHRDVAAAVEARYDTVVSGGSVDDFWAVDAARRVWVGPSWYDGRRWTSAAADMSSTAGHVRFAPLAVSAGDERVWVPFESSEACPMPLGCGTWGLARISAAGSARMAITGAAVPEVAAYGVAELRLVPRVRLASQGLAASRAASPDAERVAAVTSHALYLLPDLTPIGYPYLADTTGARLPSPPRNAGHATAAVVRPDGLLQVFTWVETHLGRNLVHGAFTQTWSEARWTDIEDLTTIPLFVDGVSYDRLIAAAYGPDGSLWVTSAAGRAAVRRGATWHGPFDAANSPLPAGRPVLDVAVSAGGDVAFATQSGLLVLRGAALPRAVGVLPFVLRRAP